MRQPRSGDEQHGGPGQAGEQRAFAQPRRPTIITLALGTAAPEIFQLPAIAVFVADPVLHHPRQPGRVGARALVAQQAGATHRMPDPAQVHVLFLQEAVIAEGIVRRNLHAGQAPVQLHAQAFGQAAVVEVFALPLPGAARTG